MNTAEADLYRQALEQAGRTRKDAERMRKHAQRTIRDVAPKAREAGVPVEEIARVVGMTRRGVYLLLR